MARDLARVIRDTMSGKSWPYQLSLDEGFGMEGLKTALEHENLVVRHTPNYPEMFPGFGGGKWYIWPLTKEAAMKWNLPDDINLYLPPDLLTYEGSGIYRMPDGRCIVSYENYETYWRDGKYAVEHGSRAVIGELEEGYIHDGYGGLSFVRGGVPEKYVPISELRAKRRALMMSDGEYELAIGEGIPADSPLLQTEAARKARAKLAGGEVA